MKKNLFIIAILITWMLSSCRDMKKNEEPIENIENLIYGKKIVVLNFWSIFCMPCIKEMPIISSLFDEYKKSKDISITTVALNSENELGQFLTRDSLNIYGRIYNRINTKIEFPILAYYRYSNNLDSTRNIVGVNHENDSSNLYLFSKYKLEGIPTTIIFFNGKEYKRFAGFGDDSLEYRKKISDVITFLNNKK